MLYEILKTAKLSTTAAPDMFTGLLAQKMKFAKGSGEIAELSGVPPLRFKSNGEPLLDWQITGNTVQNGTPTPTNPVFVQGVGELDGGQYKILISNGQQTTNIYLGSTQTVRLIKKLTFTGNEDWQVSPAWKKTNTSVFFYNQPDMRNITDTTGLYVMSDKFEATSRDGLYNGDSDMIAKTGGYAMTVRVSDSIATTAQDFKMWLASNPVTVYYVLATATTAAVNGPLMKIGNYADTLSMTDTGIVIPTVRGNNVLTVDTTVQPSEVYIKYKK